MTTTAGEVSLGKLADFDDIYDCGDPRRYFRAFASLDYEVPHHGQQVFRRVIDALPTAAPLVVDLCCSYGVNAALLKHRLDLQDLYDHYRSPYVTDLDVAELADLDQQFFSGRRLDGAPTVVGVDRAGSAVDYAQNVGLLDLGVEEDLESDDPSPLLASLVGEADLLTVTGGIGYITETTFDRLLACRDDSPPPWIAALCLRTVPFEPIAACFDRHGLVTEQLPDTTFPQRRFADPTEQDYALAQIEAQGLDPDGREADGRYHVDVYLARPPAQAAHLPITELLADLTTPDPSPTPN